MLRDIDSLFVLLQMVCYEVQSGPTPIKAGDIGGINILVI